MQRHTDQALLWFGPFLILLIATVLVLLALVRSNFLFICLTPVMFMLPFVPGAFWARKIYLGDEVSIPVIGGRVAQLSDDRE